MLSVTNLSVVYGSGDRARTVLEDVSLTLTRGRTLALVGESGAGKSTLGLALTGLLGAGGAVRAGDMQYKGRSLTHFTEADWEQVRGVEIASIFQNPMTALNPFETIGRQITETLITRMGLTATAAHTRAQDVLLEVGLRDPHRILKAHPHALSGGMLQRCLIAIALSCEPSVLIADEPTTALDVMARNEIIALLGQSARARDIGLLLITHDLSLVSRLADQIAVMREGRIVEHGDAEPILAAPKAPYTRDLFQSVPPHSGKQDRFFEPFAPSSPDQRTEHTGAGSFLEDATKGSEATPLSQGPAIQIDGLSVTFGPKTGWIPRKAHTPVEAVRDVSLSIAGGEIFGIIGGSGSGKTTLARTIAGLQEPTQGTVIIEGIEERQKGAKRGKRALRPQLQMIFQNPFASLNPRHPIRDQLVEAARHTRGLARDTAHVEAERLVAAVGLNPADLDRYPHTFSGGQLQRLSIARALAAKPTILICDEPTSALDVTVQASLLNLLKDLRDALGLTILFISHDIAVCRHLCDRIAVMDFGQICEEGETLQVLDGPTHPFTRTLIASVQGTGQLGASSALAQGYSGESAAPSAIGSRPS